MEQDQSMQELLKLLEESGRKAQAADLSALLFYMDGMQRQYAAVLQELQEVRKQLDKTANRTSPAKTALQKAFAALERQLDAVRERLQEARDALSAWAKDTVEDVKIMGVTALDKAMSTLHVKPALEAAQKGLQQSVSGTKAAIERGEAVGAELRTAKRHIRNAVYTLLGKKIPTHLSGDAGRFQNAVLAPLRGIHKTLSGMNNNALGMIGLVERLEQSAERGRERRAEKKPSIRAEMKSLQAEIAARDAAKQQEKQPKEAVI